TASTRRRMVLWRPAGDVGAVHRAFGFPKWALRPLEQLPVAIVEGETRLTSGARTITASRGARLHHRELAEAGTVRGFGDVRVEEPARRPGEPDLVATGNDGFVLTVGPTLDVLQ